MRRRIPAVTLLALCAALALSGCASPIASGQCVDWVGFETPARAAADADAVVIGTVAEQAGTADLYGETVNVWRVDVTEWMQGAGAASIDVVSVPRTCETGSPYPEGDPLDTGGEVLLFLRADGARWQTITPYQGVLPAPADGELPDAWP